jgi:hypothetical protein
MPIVARDSEVEYDRAYFLYAASAEARELAYATPEARTSALMVPCLGAMAAINPHTSPRMFLRPLDTIQVRRRAATVAQAQYQERLQLSDHDMLLLREFARMDNDGPMEPYKSQWCDSCAAIVWDQGVCQQCGGCNNCTPRCRGCRKCDVCCTDCSKCAECGLKRAAYGCRNCAKCTECCRCPKCQHCGPMDPGTQICALCNRCPGCGCRCDQTTSYHPSTMIWESPGHRMAGMEIEFNDAPKFRAIRAHTAKWGASVMTDGSCGFECVTSPAAGDFLKAQVLELGEAMRLAGATADPRCGVHCHVDARDLNLHAIRRLTAVYGLVEPVMYIMGGQERTIQHYCMPNGVKLLTAAMSEKWHTMVIRAIYQDKSDLKRMSKNKENFRKKEGGRYVGMNLCPWVAGRVHKTKDTTVEFRLHKNCLDPARLYEWARLLVQLVDFSKKATWDEVMALPSDSARALCIVAPASREFVVKRIRDWRHSHKRAVRLVQFKIPKQLSTLKKPRKAFWAIGPSDPVAAASQVVF